ncbi:protein kinase c [Plakobranchus ocellatus]|uniref:Protein kinase c n=1 Tax=Plakobranchus ocellatus TaxID=259542 RepID=A0AAV3ZPW0_9GAST|nr:protein kinase c [Plakobranchus ocellatus]
MTDCGKPYIKAPEVYEDKPCGLAMDWWSVGILTYRFITGKYPFKTEKLTEGYQSVTKHHEKYPEWAFEDPCAKALCQGLLIKKPKERLASENEEYVIKSHPYFCDVDWDAQEDVIEMAKEILVVCEDIVLRRLLLALGITPPCVPHVPLPPYPPVRSNTTLASPDEKPASKPVSTTPSVGVTPRNMSSMLPRGDGNDASGKDFLLKSAAPIKETTV